MTENACGVLKYYEVLEKLVSKIMFLYEGLSVAIRPRMPQLDLSKQPSELEFAGDAVLLEDS